MNKTNLEVEEINKKINRVKLMIEKRKERIAYYGQLLKMGIAYDDAARLEIYAALKSKEVKNLQNELEWLYTQKSFYE